jgi:hypothetical protein
MKLKYNYAIKIQKWFRGIIYRKKILPLVLYYIQKYLANININLTYQSNDGRINSSIDETEIIHLISKKFKIKIPTIRKWYDILIYDHFYGWIPVNIKITTTLTNDNAGNLAMCVYAYTNYILNLDNSYTNGDMSKILIEKLNNKQFNHNTKKDYYFLVINKKNSKDIIINCIKGINILTPNVNNLPFQICWNKNREYKYDIVKNKIKIFLECIKKSNPSWKEEFINKCKLINI